jgi:thymidylate kinase
VKKKRQSKKRSKGKNTRQHRSKKDGFVFSIAGIHGVGKTTIYSLLESMFENNLTVKLYPERLMTKPPVPFGSKDKQTAFRSEIHYTQQMMARNELLKKFIKNRRENVAILDRSPYSTLIYTKALCLPKIDYNLIGDMFKSVDWAKDRIILLEAEPKTVMNRIYCRGSLDKERLKWNEDDFQYLLKVLTKYDEVFNEAKLKEQNRLDRIWTENKTPHEVVDEILKIIERKSGLHLKTYHKIPINQSKLTSWI